MGIEKREGEGNNETSIEGNRERKDIAQT